jgi:hypothetical protein
MKTRSFFFLLFTATILLVSCKKKDPAPAIEKDPAVAADMITFSEDYTELYREIPCHNTHLGADAWEMTGDAISTIIFIDFPSDAQEGVTYDLSAGEAHIRYTNCYMYKMWHATSGTITVSEIDQDNHIIRGTFEASVYNDGSGISPQGPTTGPASTIAITGGTFDCYYD